MRGSSSGKAAVITAGLLLAACLTANASDSTPPAPAITLSYTPGKVTEETMEHGGRTRRFLYYTPMRFDIRAAHPLIFILHAYNQPVEALVSGYATMQPRADADGTILVYPSSTGAYEKRSLAWNTRYGTCRNTSYPEVDKVDDVGWISFLMDCFLKGMNADPDRIYATGVSLGGAMTYSLSCYLSDSLAAVAPVIMQMSPKLVKDLPSARPLPIMIITGTADPRVPTAGNGLDPSKDMLPLVSMERTLSYWKTRNGITGAPVKTDLPNTIKEVFKAKPAPSNIEKYVWAGKGGNDVVWLKVVNGGHWLPVWAGGKALDASNLGGNDYGAMGNINCDYDAAAGIYEFLLSHQR